MLNDVWLVDDGLKLIDVDPSSSALNVIVAMHTVPVLTVFAFTEDAIRTLFDVNDPWLIEIELGAQEAALTKFRWLESHWIS